MREKDAERELSTEELYNNYPRCPLSGSCINQEVKLFFSQMDQLLNAKVIQFDLVVK